MAVLGGEEKEVFEVEDVIGQEDSVVSKRDTGDGVISDGDTKIGELGSSSLLVVV